MTGLDGWSYIRNRGFVLLGTFMRFGTMARWACSLLAVTTLTLSSAQAKAASWYPLGPFGGDARALAADPADSRHLYLGTEIGWLYESRDAGATWKRVSQVGKQDDLVIDHILVDTRNPKRLIVGTWRIGSSDGGVYISEDSGRTWYAQAEMKRQSVRAMARSESDPQIIVAGTLQGVFQSKDNGNHWKQISPFESKEIHEVESLAIDPADPNTIYAGTWHLPWKTTDGGENWVNIKQGIIDDSDVFSIIIDPKNTKTIYLSACSGIYKSSDAAEQFRKIQGIPSTARRTRKLLQDPTDRNTVFAGTTEGLYKTTDAGRTFSRMTEADVIVNDVYVDPKTPSHVLIATDRGGVLSSDDGGTTFSASNAGFSARQVSSFAADPHNPARIYVGVVNGKLTGGVFASSDGGLKWQQDSAGLHGHDVFSLVETASGTLLAGTGHGIYRQENDLWLESNDLAEEPTTANSPLNRPKSKAPAKRPASTPRSRQTRASATSLAHRRPATWFEPNSFARLQPASFTVAKKRRVRAKKISVAPLPAKQVPAGRTRGPVRKADEAITPKPTSLDAVVYALERRGDAIFAGTDHGLLRSDADGHSWQKVNGFVEPDVRFLASHDQTFFAAGLKQSAISLDGGTSWKDIALPAGLSQIGSICVDDSGTLWMGGVEGIFYSKDHGATWETLRALFLRAVNGIYADFSEHRIYVASSLSSYAFIVHVPDYKVTFADTGWPLRFIRPVGDHLLAATLFEGTIVQPVMTDTPFHTSGR